MRVLHGFHYSGLVERLRRIADDEVIGNNQQAQVGALRDAADAIEAQRERIERLTFALQGLHDDMADYSRLNHLGAENNHWMVIARAALEAKS